MKLKHGKKYETADGTVYKVYTYDDDTFDHKFGDENIWRTDGTSLDTLLPDLIRRHYTKPQPSHKLDLNPGDVVQLVAWEDGSYHALGWIDTIDHIDTDYPKGERPLFRVVTRQAQPS